MTSERVRPHTALPMLPPEAQLLFAATMPRRAQSDAALATLMQSPLEWTLVNRLAEREKLESVLWNRLRDHAENIPADVAARLKRRAAVIDFRMSMTASVLQRAVGELAKEKIRVMLLKGAALAATVYPSFTERPMGDLDILVHAADAERAWKRMLTAGWTPELSGGEEFHASHHHLPALLDPQGLELVLEIHRALLLPNGPFLLNEADVWRDAQPVQLGSTEVSVPSSEHQLLHLCIHFAWSHMLADGLGRTARDVATLLGSRSLRWPKFAEMAMHARAGSCAYWTLRISRTLSGVDVPPEVFRQLSPRQPASISRALERAYINAELFNSCPSVRLARILWVAGLRPSASGHGGKRPWQVEEMFRKVFHLPDESRVNVRLVAQLGHLVEWGRFLRVVGTPRRVL